MRVDSFATVHKLTPGPELERALLATDSVIGHLTSRLDPERDLLLIISPTSPLWERETHLGVAIAWGRGFPRQSGLRSGVTRQENLVTLPDIAPTILDHLGLERPAGMLGRSFVPIEADGDRIDANVDLDRESVFVHGTKAEVSTIFVLGQIAVYAIALAALTRWHPLAPWASTALEAGALAIAAFPLISYLQSPIPAHRLGATGYGLVLVALDIAVVTLVMVFLKGFFKRFLLITALTALLMMGDLLLGTNLQLNAIWGNDPLVAGRFSGLGNIAFAVFGTCVLMTGALLVERWPRSRWIAAGVGGLFVLAVIVDGAPGLGSDVGGTLALVPALAISWLMLIGRRPTVKTLVLVAIAAIALLGLFLVFDLSRPTSEQTHLARLWQDAYERGGRVFIDTIERKVNTQLRVFGSTIWTYLVPPALAVIAFLLLRPRGRWHILSERYPRLRSGLLGSLLLGILGFAVNDSGIVVPAIVLSFIAPLALLMHLKLERDAASLH